MVLIKVPKTPKSAFDRTRPASALIRSQIEQLEAAVANVPAPSRARSSAQSKRPKRRSVSEGEAAAYIEKLTRQLHPEAAKAQMPIARAGADRTDRPVARRRKRARRRKQKSARKGSRPRARARTQRKAR